MSEKIFTARRQAVNAKGLPFAIAYRKAMESDAPRSASVLSKADSPISITLAGIVRLLRNL